MKAARLLAPIAIGIYIFHGIVLTPVFIEYVTFGENLKNFLGISALQGTEAIDYEGFGYWFIWLLGGIINIGLIVVMALSLASKEKSATPVTNQWGATVAGVPERQAPPPPPVD